jgi:arsenate reductase (glutaredoxin)
MTTIYHNPRCRKSRAGLQYLQEKTSDIHIREYLNDPLSKEELSRIIKKMKIHPKEMVRTQEDVYKNEFKGKEYSESEWIDIMIRHPKLLQRPIVETNDQAILAQPPEKIDQLI